MSLPDSPLIAGTPGQYALIQRISATAQGTTAVAATSTAKGVFSGSISLPISKGQGIQIRNASAVIWDSDATHHLTGLSAFINLGDANGAALALRPMFNQAVLLGDAAGCGPAGGAADWPFLAWNDFPQNASSIPTPMALAIFMAIANNDAAPHSVAFNLTCIWEIWQAFDKKLGHVGL